jgi:hypothetical protein
MSERVNPYSHENHIQYFTIIFNSDNGGFSVIIGIIEGIAKSLWKLDRQCRLFLEGRWHSLQVFAFLFCFLISYSLKISHRGAENTKI